MIITQAIVHILDKNTGNLLLSQEGLDLSQPTLVDYLTKLNEKVQKADPKHGQIEAESELALFLRDPSQSFIEKSHILAEKLFNLIAPAEEIPAADYLFFQASPSIIGILRLDYSSKFTHFLEQDGDSVVNTIIMNHAILPTGGQTPSEAFVLDLDSLTYQLLEKKYVIEGKRQNYFSQQFLEIPTTSSTKEQIKEIKKTVSHVAKKFNEEDYVALATTQQVIYQQLEENDHIDASQVFEQVFKENPLAKEASLQAIQEEKVAPTIPVHNPAKYERKYSKQKFKLANGIEITIPSQVYDDKEIIEFLNNPDGSISVLIKNIDSIMNRFNG